MSYAPSKKGNSDLDVGPSVVLTTNEDDTMVFWAKVSEAVVERQVIWGAESSSQLLEQGIDWADAGTGAAINAAEYNVGGATVTTGTPPFFAAFFWNSW